MKSLKWIGGGCLFLIGCSQLSGKEESQVRIAHSGDANPLAIDEDGEEIEEVIGVELIPANVRAAAESAVPGLVIVEAEKETLNATVSYCVHGEAEGTWYEVEVTSAGVVLEVEVGDDEDESGEELEDSGEEVSEKVALSDIPAQVLAAALAAVPGFSVSRAELESGETAVIYCLEGPADSKWYDIDITPKGVVVEIDEKAADDGEDE